jgi:hypothetical protein
MSAANQSDPRAQGDLSRTPFAHLVLYLHREAMSGTLVIDRGGFETKVLFRNGRAVAARPLPRGAGLQDGLLELCSLPEGAYGFWDGDLIGEASGVTRGTVDPFTFVTESLRGHVRDHVVSAVVDRYRGMRMTLVPDADLKKLGLRGVEARVAEQLRRLPRQADDFIEHSELAPSEARKLLYLLLITKQVAPEGGDASSASGVRSAIASTPPGPLSSIPPRSAAPGASASVHPPAAPSSVRPASTAPAHTPTQRPSGPPPPRTPSSPGSQPAPSVRPQSSVPAWQQLASLRPGSTQPGASSRSAPPPGPLIPTPSMAPPPVESLDEAGKLRRAEQLAERRNLGDALRIVDDLIACDPKNPDSQAMRAWILYQEFSGTRVPRPLLDAIEAALRLNEEHPRALYVKGLVFKRIGKLNEAVRYFQRALDANPQHIEAQRELRLARMRRER